MIHIVNMDHVAKLRFTLELAHAVVGAERSGLLRRLSSVADTTDGHAEALGLSPRGTGKLLRVLADAGFALRDGERYGASDALVELGRRTPHGLSGVTRVWGHLPTYLQTGEPMMQADGDVTERQRVYSDVVGALGRMFAPSAERLAMALAPLAPRTLLDVGAGSGVWSLAVARIVEELRVTAQDLPAVLDAFRSRAAQLGLEDRVATVARSFHDEPLGEGRYDLVLLAGVIHLEPPASASALIARAARAVSPAGRLVVVDSIGGEGADALARSLYALNLALRTRRGAPHGRGALVGWLDEAGAVTVDDVDLPAPGLGALVATMSG